MAYHRQLHVLECSLLRRYLPSNMFIVCKLWNGYTYRYAISTTLWLTGDEVDFDDELKAQGTLPLTSEAMLLESNLYLSFSAV